MLSLLHVLTPYFSRASRIRCDGTKSCANCATKNKTCTYTKSNRGGPRVSRKSSAPSANHSSTSKPPTPPREDLRSQQSTFENPDDAFWDLTPMILPGAGLKDVDSDLIFDSIFSGRPQNIDFDTEYELMDVNMSSTVSQTPICRAYNSDKAMLVLGHLLKSWHLHLTHIPALTLLLAILNIQFTFTISPSLTLLAFKFSIVPSPLACSLLRSCSHFDLQFDSYTLGGCLTNRNCRLNAYYIFIHSYFPILPPPDSDLVADEPSTFETNDFEPSSPLSLALSAILVLIPHPEDPDPRLPESTLLRRQKAHMWAEAAMDAVEIESEMLASSLSPGEALSGEPESFCRKPFHSRTLVELEGLLAYLVLSVYEYAQRGNIAKMRNRASQAYDAAIRLSIHEGSNSIHDDQFSEARRRAWWMTVCHNFR